MINGGGAAPNLTGVFQRLTTPAAPAAGLAGFDHFVALFAGGIDGLWANTASEIGIVVNPETYRLALQSFRDRIIDTGKSWRSFSRRNVFRGLRSRELRRILDKQADAGQSRARVAVHSVPRRAFRDGLVDGDANCCLPALG